MSSTKKKLPSFNSLADLKPNANHRANLKSHHAANKAKKSAKRRPASKKGELSQPLTALKTKAEQALLANNLLDAKQYYDDVITQINCAVDKRFAAVYSNRGIVNARLGDIHSAITDFEKAVSLDTQYTFAYSNLANAYLSTRQFDKAYAAITHALRLDPDDYNANFNHFIILTKLKRYADAVAAVDAMFIRFHDKMQTLDPSPFIDVKKQVCDWQDIEVLEQSVAKLIDKDTFAAKWALVHINNHALDGAQQLKVLRRYSQQAFGHLTRHLDPASASTPANRKIRVAYVSSDFHDHATTHLMAQLFESHDHTLFEWYAISHSVDDNSAMRQRVIKAFDHFVEVSDWTDAHISSWMRAQHIDIAIDLKGHTGSNRLGIFARGCAPVQMTYIGFPGTTGSTFMDYIIGDKWVTPLSAQAQFSETILQLPHCYQPNDRQRYLPSQALQNSTDPDYLAWRKQQRTAEGLPTDAIVLCCFNNGYKLHPSSFALWMRLLKKHPNSVLWLLADKPLSATNLRAQARLHGVEDHRIHFAPRANQRAYLSRYLLADLFVDTFAYNAHTTGSDALWVGLPIVTLAGDSFASRVAASLLDSVGLAQLITHTPADYEQKVDALMSDPEQLTTLSQHLRNVRDTTPLFDAQQTARDLEALYRSVL